MCSFDPNRVLASTLQDVTVQRGVVKDLALNGREGQHAVVSSTSGSSYKLGDKIDDVQKGLGEIRKLFPVIHGMVDESRPLVAKIYPINRIEANKHGDDFLREIAIHTLMHVTDEGEVVEGIVPIQEVILTEDRLMMVMPFYNKRDLFYWLTNRTGLLPAEDVKAIFRRLAKAVARVHGADYFHRDISCENFYCHVGDVTDQRTVFREHEQTQMSDDEALAKRPRREEYVLDLGDFGMAGHVSTGCDLNTKIGKPSYRSPELVAGCLPARVINWQAGDVWAMGVVLHVLLMSSFPFTSAHMGDRSFVDRVINKNLVERTRQELGRAAFRGASARDVKERLAGMALVQRIFAYKAAERPTVQDLLSDPWLAEPVVVVEPVATPQQMQQTPQAVMSMSMTTVMSDAVLAKVFSESIASHCVCQGNQVASPVTLCAALLTAVPLGSNSATSSASASADSADEHMNVDDDSNTNNTESGPPTSTSISTGQTAVVVLQPLFGQQQNRTHDAA